MIYGKALNISVTQDTIEKIREWKSAVSEYRALAAGMKGDVPDASKVEELEREVIRRLGHHALNAVDQAGSNFLRFP